MEVDYLSKATLWSVQIVFHMSHIEQELKPVAAWEGENHCKSLWCAFKSGSEIMNVWSAALRPVRVKIVSSDELRCVQQASSHFTRHLDPPAG